MSAVVDWNLFARYFTDEQILAPSYAISEFSDGAWCKLCDSRIIGSPEKHLSAHARELRAWRRGEDRTIGAKKVASLKLAREAKRLRQEAA